MRASVVNRLLELAEQNERILLITGDLGFGVLTEFAARLPRQYLNAGVAEQNMSGIACGLALDGRTVFTYAIANFPTLRCLEHVRNSICYHRADVKIIATGCGFSYGQLGMSHHATEDLAIMRALPNMVVVAPCDEWEAASAVDALVERPGPAYLRLDKSTSGTAGQPAATFRLGEARTLRGGTDLTLIGVGGVLREVLATADRLAAHGIAARVVSMHTLKPLDRTAIAAAVEETGNVITVEEHSLIGGLGSAVAEVCLDEGLRPARFRRIGICDQYSSVGGDQDYLRQLHSLDRKAITRAALDLMGRAPTAE
jgi:transketolase